MVTVSAMAFHLTYNREISFKYLSIEIDKHNKYFQQHFNKTPFSAMEGDIMAFDKNVDKNLFSETKEFEMTRITVGVFQYNDGEKKLQISRENRSQENEWSFAKLGRMFKDEAEAVIPMMQKALKKMD